MTEVFEIQDGNLTISTDQGRLDLEAICGFLARSYWAQKRSRATIERSLRNSLVFGAYDGQRQVAMARLITDRATFGWLVDVFVHEDYRGRGIGKMLMKAMLSHPDLQRLRRWLLATRDAFGLYSQFGFTPLQNPETWMERFNPEAN